ncbi:MAG: tetratricopeptide repeat protein [Planctomycetales bacterium]|nr:tetratricopeptide repeat protein [Planctomycetales bacterium]
MRPAFRLLRLVLLICAVTGCTSARDQAEKAYNLGALALQGEGKPDLTKAYSHFNQAIALDKTYVPAYLGRAYVLQQNGQSEAALAEYDKASKLDPKSGNTLYLRGRLNRDLGDYPKAAADLRAAISLFTEAINEDFRKAPEFETKRRKASLELAIALYQQGDNDGAMTELEATLTLMEGSIKKDPDVYFWRGRIFYDRCHPADGRELLTPTELRDNYNAAIRDFGNAIWIDKNYADAYCRRGWALFETGDYAMAKSDSESAIELDEKLADAYYNLARIHSMANDSTFRDGKAAVQAAGMACRLTSNKSWYCLAAAGAAFAELGDFVKAQKAQQLAIQLAPQHAQGELRERLAMFRKKQPFRHRLLETTARKSSSSSNVSAK